MVYSIMLALWEKIRVSLVVVVTFMEAYHLCSMFFIPCACRFRFHNNLWPVNCHSDLKKKNWDKKLVKLPKRYSLVSTKRYHFGSFMYTGWVIKRLAASGFFSRNGTVSYRLVSVSELFKEPPQELGAKVPKRSPFRKF